MRPVTLLGFSAVVTCLFLTTGAQADPVGTQSFVDIGTPTAGGSPTGNINTATTFTLGDLVSGGANSGVFAGMPTQVFGSVSFDVTIPTSLTFGDSVFGTFASTSIIDQGGPPAFVNIEVLGNWTPGTFGSVTGGPFASEFRISLSQTPPSNGTIGASATFATPPSLIPEPSGTSMFLAGLAAAVVSYGVRRRRRGLMSNSE